VESFAGIAESLIIARRIANAGGQLQILAMDEPYFFAHVYDGTNACHWPVEKVAAEVGNYVKQLRDYLPDVIVGDTEPLSGAADAPAYASWLETFRKVNGYSLAFLHMDVDWSRPNWPLEIKSIVDEGSTAGVPVGMIYFGNDFDSTDEAWISAAGARVKKLELDAGVQPDHILFQSWEDKPDYVLPESQPYTWTNFIDAYFTDKSKLGYRTEGAGANLAVGKVVHVSAAIADGPAQAAVDGDLATLWSSGGGPPQWIEIDLGGPHSVRQINLTTSQYPAGETVHRLLARGPGGNLQLLHTFSGPTDDGQVLSFTPSQPIAAVQFIRVETTQSPSWVAWREIQVIAGQ
jgi:hypothetical protein